MRLPLNSISAAGAVCIVEANRFVALKAYFVVQSAPSFVVIR